MRHAKTVVLGLAKDVSEPVRQYVPAPVPAVRIHDPAVCIYNFSSNGTTHTQLKKKKDERK